MEEIKKILIPTDGSERGKIAIEKGLSLAHLLNAKVLALYVIDITAFEAIPPNSLITSVSSLLRDEGEKAVSYIKEEGEKIGIEVETMITEGSPAKEILEKAEECDMVVMATVGKTGLTKLLMGSVTEKVVRHAPCPVLVVRVNEG